MALYDEINEVHDSNSSYSSHENDIDDLCYELYDSLVKVKKDLR